MADNGSVVCVANRGALVVKTMGSKHDSRNSLPNSPKATIRRQNNADNTFINNKQKPGSAAVIVVKDGNILTGIRKSEFAGGLLCGAGGHVEEGETLKQTAARECKEEFGITPKGMIQLGYGAWEPDTGLKPAIFLCTDYEGDIVDESSEMEEIKFRSLSEINEMSKLTFQPFKDSLEMMVSAVTGKQAKKIKKTIDKPPADVTIKADEGSSVQQLIFELLHEDDEEEHWISTKTGSHILLNESNEVISGANASDDELIGICKLLREDGAPEGNQNAAGPHNMSKSAEEKTEKQHASQKISTNIGRAHFTRDGNTMKVDADTKIKFNSGVATLKEGTIISDVSDFAGKGCKKPLEIRQALSDQIGGNADDWTHAKGNATIITSKGKEKNVEIHWFENPSEGQAGMKIKRFNGGNKK